MSIFRMAKEAAARAADERDDVASSPTDPPIGAFEVGLINYLISFAIWRCEKCGHDVKGQPLRKSWTCDDCEVSP